jgi:NADH:ubiquinone oxidoreductase subunit 3 (subunit A)
MSSRTSMMTGGGKMYDAWQLDTQTLLLVPEQYDVQTALLLPQQYDVQTVLLFPWHHVIQDVALLLLQ